MKTLLSALLFLILFTGIFGIAFAQDPIPPPSPQPIPEPEPIPKKEPKPIEEPFPGLSDDEKIEKLTEENKKLKTEKAQLQEKVKNLEIEKGFLQSQIQELQKSLNDLNAVALEQIKVIMDLVTQLKDTVFEGLFSPIKSA